MPAQKGFSIPLVLLLVATVAAVGFLATRAFRPVDCPHPRDPQSLPEGYYKGPMIDTHVHIDSLADPGFGGSISEWICMMDVEDTEKAFVLFPVWEPIIKESLDLAKEATEVYPGRFIPFIGTPDRDGSPDGFPTVDVSELREMLDAYPGLFAGYGEIGLYARPGGAPALSPVSERLTEIYPLIRENRLIIYFHLGEDHKESFERVLEANRDIPFIWHGDQLIECQACPKNLDYIAQILERHPNVYYGIDQLYGNVWLLNPEVTKKQFLAHFSDYQRLLEIDLANWKALIERYPDQVLWGTDRGAEWSRDPEVAIVLNDYERAFIGRLDPAVQEKFAYQNAERLIKNAGKALTAKEITRNTNIPLPRTIQHLPLPSLE